MPARLRTSLPVHPTLTHPDGTPVHALGISSRTGRLIWPVRGAAPDDDDGGDSDGDDQDDADGDDQDDAGSEDQDDDKPLGPKGEKALEAEKSKRRAAQAQLREWKALGLTAAEVSKRLAALPKDDDKAPDADAIRAEIRAEVDAERQRERILDKIEAKAARAFADPDDAAALLLRGKDINDFLDDDGKIDVQEIEDGLEALLKNKPYLAAQGGKRFKGGGDGGARKEQKPKAASLQEAVAARIAAGKT